MATSKSSTTSKSDGAKKTSIQPKDAVSRRRRSIQMVQNVLLIWLDNNIDESSADCRNTITQLRRIVNTINQYADDEQCIEFLQSIENEKACMIISGSLGQHVVPQVHDMLQVDSIFIFCGNKKYHEQWAKEWPKIKGVFTEIGPICEALKKAADQCEQNSLAISIMATSGDLSKKNLDQLEPSFMYTQILKEVLLSINFEQKHIHEYIQYCHDALVDNEGELKNVKKFERQYGDQSPIWWYTYPCFLYPMLNRALRLMDTEMIVNMSFFIGDLHRHIEQLHQEQFGGHRSNKSFIVYRGQGLSKVDFEQLSKTRGGLLSFNNFLSTSKKQEISMRFVQDALANVEMVGVLFVMTIDPTQSNTPFASITGVSYFEEKEDEVLFSMHTVFRIGEITPMDETNRLFQVNLILTSDNDKDLRALTDRIREETLPDDEGWFRLGEVLKKMGQFDKAQQVYEILLEQTTDESERRHIYGQLGRIHQNKGNYQEAITFFEQALEIKKKILPPTDTNLAVTYHNISMVYNKMGDYPKALSSYEKALAIQQQSLPPNHPDLASTYNDIGRVYRNMDDYPKALSFHEKALAIQQQSLPPNHTDLAMSYKDIGSVHRSMGDCPKALSFHEKALAIQQQSLPPNHPDLAKSYNGIGSVHRSMGDYPKALSFHEKALAIRQQSLPPNHPDLAKSYNGIGSVHRSMGDYPKALSFYEKALAIQQQSLPPNHPDLASSYNNIGTTYRSMRDYPKALSFHEKALAIEQQSLPPNHTDLASSYNNIGTTYRNMRDYPKALSFYEKALAIQQQSLPPNHPDLASTYNDIGRVYRNMNDYPKALSFYEKALAIRLQSLPPNHPDLAKSYNKIGAVYHNMGDYPKALSFHEKALAIEQQSLPPNHTDLASSYNNIGTTYRNMRDYPKALSFYEHAVDIAQQSLLSGHPHLKKYRNDLERVKKKL